MNYKLTKVSNSSVASNNRNLPCLIGSTPYLSHNTHVIADSNGLPIVNLSKVPRLIQNKILIHASNTSTLLHSVNEKKWFAIFAKAGTRLREIAINYPSVNNTDLNFTLASRISGLPEIRIVRALDSLGQYLLNMNEIIRQQSPDGTVSIYQHGNSLKGWSWVPAGRNLVVQVPGNFPTININWLIALACRRPVVLCASINEPYTPFWISKILYDAGMPDGAISLCYENPEALWQNSDQIICYENFEVMSNPWKAKIYNYGSSKAILLNNTTEENLWSKLAHMAVQGCGRLCTNLSALIVDNDAKNKGLELARALAQYPIRFLNDQHAVVPAFNPSKGRQIVQAIESAISRGATDLSAIITGEKLELLHDGMLYLRPTVLLLDYNDPLMGKELPFPFVTVTSIPRSAMLPACKGSLIISLIGNDKELIQDLLREPTIDKVFSGSEFARGYNPMDPHAGFLSDFLFFKKAVMPYSFN